ncbi:DUF551 domain-containing protein [Enterobacter hormaechei]|uniref:DUF551 domain-containing protein n=2 Tax=Enterobacter hormaechei TaxID=158836 RepID=UPI0007958BAE|nr:DUF551 domain-containing protein [Enterobacter hormaechei]WMA51895.1 DUF551 domain-containing protein [Enterobacter hormaechei]SAD86092.1 Protein of uncharacterised function (DUF551) [Enterobacter hormaechei]
MSELTKEWLQQTIAELEEERDATPGAVNEDASNALAAMKLALASLEAESVSVNDDMAYAFHHAISDSSLGSDEVEEIKAGLRAAFANVTAQPAPASVPEPIKRNDADGWWMYKGRRVGGGCAEWYNRALDDCRAAMLQGADRPQNEPQNIPENIPATQFKPVADLYGLTSPTGGETSFTFDAVEARDFIDGGWLCQEYVTLERYQEAITNHTEDKLAMVDHSGDSNNMVEPVTTAYKLRDAVETIRSSGIAIDADKIFAERDVLNSPVIPDGWVACSERMPEDDDFVYIWPRPDFGVELHVAQYGKFDKRDAGWYAQVYEQNYGIEYYPVRVTHWMPLPAAPQQEVK